MLKISLHCVYTLLHHCQKAHSASCICNRA